MRQAIQHTWRELAAIDLRTLALFRICIALVVLIDLATFWPNLSFFLTDSGLYPRQYAMWDQRSHTVSLFFMSGAGWVMHALFLITALAALALLVGFHTRIASVICWAMIASLNGRAMAFLSGADMQLVVLLFWAMFLPLGARFSVDEALARKENTQQRLASLSTFAILLQVTYLYFIGALLKTGGAWHTDFTAVQAAISNIQFATPLSYFLLQWPEFMKWLTFFVYYLELLVIVLIFSPFYTQWCRLAAFGMLFLLHVGFLFFLDISYFPLISITGVVVLIPSMVWNRLDRFTERYVQAERHVIYYDEPCDFCHKVCRIFGRLSLMRGTQIVAAQSNPEMHALMERENSWIVKRPDGSTLLHWEAVAYVWRRSPFFWPLGVLFLPGFMKGQGYRLYRQIADHRPTLARWSGRLIPWKEKVSVKPSLANLLVVAPLVTITMIMNIKSIEEYHTLEAPAIFHQIMDTTRLWQRWNMFAPFPAIYHSWIEVNGIRRNGETVDLLEDFRRAPKVDTPTLGREAYPIRRLHKYFSGVKWRRRPIFPAEAFCRRWHAQHPREKLERVAIVVYRQLNRLDRPPRSEPIKKSTMMEFDCVKWRPWEADKPAKPS